MGKDNKNVTPREMANFFNIPYSEIEKLKKHVNKFRRLMIAKLEYKANKGFSGWDSPDYKPKFIIEQIKHHLQMLEKGQPQEIDIANLAMFLYFKSHKINEDL